MKTNKFFKFIGVLENDKEFFFRGIDIGKAKSEYVHKFVFLIGKRKIKVQDIYVKVVSINGVEFVFYGEKNHAGCVEIYELSEAYEIEIKNMYEEQQALNIKDERELKKQFEFLLKEYGFKFAKNNLGDAVDENGRFFYYGPVYCYSIYNEKVCINIVNLVQRQDYDIYITKEYKADQVYIRNGIYGDSKDAYDFKLFAAHIRHSVVTNGEIYGIKIK